jgi:hypothetical protein
LFLTTLVFLDIGLPGSGYIMPFNFLWINWLKLTILFNSHQQLDERGRQLAPGVQGRWWRLRIGKLQASPARGR